MAVQRIFKLSAGEPLPDHLQAGLAEALDSLKELIATDEFAIFETDGTQKRFVFDLFAAQKRKLRNPRTCIFPGCGKISVAASHAIQRNGPLVSIAEENHVLTPMFNPRKRGLVMARVGIGEASTFPGFCSRHEGLFSELEQRRSLSEDRHIALQAFRTICREVVIKRQKIEDAVDALRAWKQVISERGTFLINRQLGELARFLPPVTACVVSGVSKYEAFLSSEIERLSKELIPLEQILLPLAVREIKTAESGLVHFVLRIGHSIPVCLAGIGGFNLRLDQQEHEVVAVLNVWPTRKDAAISIAVPKTQEQCLYAYLGMQLNRSLGALEMIETWMVNGSDHWFIKPSVWNQIPASRQARILDDIMKASHLGAPCPVSIFDSIREEMLTIPDEETHPPTDRSRERSKLAAWGPASPLTLDSE